MDPHSIHELDIFLEDVGFPIDKEGLLIESLDSPLSLHIQDAIALLPEGDYMTREDVRRQLIGLDDETEKKMPDDDDDEVTLVKDETSKGIEIETDTVEEGVSDEDE